MSKNDRLTWVRDSFAADIRRRSMNWLIQSRALFLDRLPRDRKLPFLNRPSTKRSRRHNTQRPAANRRALVAYQIAKQVVHHNDAVERAGVEHEEEGHGVGEEVVWWRDESVGDGGAWCTEGFGDGAAPEARRCHHVCLVCRRTKMSLIFKKRKRITDRRS